MKRNIYRKLEVLLPVNNFVHLPFPTLVKRMKASSYGTQVHGETFTKYVPSLWERLRIGRPNSHRWTSWILLRERVTGDLVWAEYYGYESWDALVDRWSRGKVITRPFLKGELKKTIERTSQ